MADDVTVDNGTGTDYDVATDDVAGKHYQRVKLDVGGDGASVPVEGTVPVSGGVSIVDEDTGVAAPVVASGLWVVANGGSVSVIGAFSGVEADVHGEGTAAALNVGGNVAHDTADSGDAVKIGGKANAAAPTDVSANNDRVDAWFLRNGAQATAITAAGALVGGDAANGLDVDVTRLPTLPAGTNNIGDVDVLTLPALPAGTANLGDVDVASIAAGDNNIGNVDIVTMPNVIIGAAIPAGNNNIGDVDIASSVVLTTKQASSTGTLANVASSASSVTLIASNASRLGATIHNDSTQILYVKFGTTASATSYTVKMVADAYYEVPYGYTGRIDGIWASANGNARVTELT
jgi:hypothetical protein